jgi:hypothetical protein
LKLYLKGEKKVGFAVRERSLLVQYVYSITVDLPNIGGSVPGSLDQKGGRIFHLLL